MLYSALLLLFVAVMAQEPGGAPCDPDVGCRDLGCRDGEVPYLRDGECCPSVCVSACAQNCPDRECGPEEEAFVPVGGCCIECRPREMHHCDGQECEPLHCSGNFIEVHRPNECCPRCVSSCSGDCEEVECGHFEEWYLPVGQCCGECRPVCRDAAGGTCPEIDCPDGQEAFSRNGDCCLNECRPVSMCSGIACDEPVCPFNHELTLLPGNCCRTCVRIDQCAGVQCPDDDECPEDHMLIPTDDGCCRECHPIDCDDSMCEPVMCGDDEEVFFPILGNGCRCPDCRPRQNHHCDGVACDMENCPMGFELFHVAGECCPVCREISACRDIDCFTECRDGEVAFVPPGECCEVCVPRCLFLHQDEPCPDVECAMDEELVYAPDACCPTCKPRVTCNNIQECEDPQCRPGEVLRDFPEECACPRCVQVENCDLVDCADPNPEECPSGRTVLIPGECCRTCAEENPCEEIACDEVECPDDQMLTFRPGSCCGECEPFLNCATVSCFYDEDLCAEDEEPYVPAGECCPTRCRPRHDHCEMAVCPNFDQQPICEGSQYWGVAPGECCPRCIYRSDCHEISCDEEPRECADDEELVMEGCCHVCRPVDNHCADVQCPDVVNECDEHHRWEQGPFDCCGGCVPITRCQDIDCPEDFFRGCPDGFELYHDDEHCCGDCRPVCDDVECENPNCDDDEEITFAPGICCPFCRKTHNLCELTDCRDEECGPNEELVYLNPDLPNCCGVCVPRRDDCANVVCHRPQCNDDEELVTRDGECCPFCRSRCDGLACPDDALDCPVGFRPLVDDGACCPRCRRVDCDAVDCPAVELKDCPHGIFQPPDSCCPQCIPLPQCEDGEVRHEGCRRCQCRGGFWDCASNLIVDADYDVENSCVSCRCSPDGDLFCNDAEIACDEPMCGPDEELAHVAGSCCRQCVPVRPSCDYNCPRTPECASNFELQRSDDGCCLVCAPKKCIPSDCPRVDADVCIGGRLGFTNDGCCEGCVFGECEPREPRTCPDGTEVRFNTETCAWEGECGCENISCETECELGAPEKCAALPDMFELVCPSSSCCCRYVRTTRQCSLPDVGDVCAPGCCSSFGIVEPGVDGMQRKRIPFMGMVDDDSVCARKCVSSGRGEGCRWEVDICGDRVNVDIAIDPVLTDKIDVAQEELNKLGVEDAKCVKEGDRIVCTGVVSDEDDHSKFERTAGVDLINAQPVVESNETPVISSSSVLSAVVAIAMVFMATLL